MMCYRVRRLNCIWFIQMPVRCARLSQQLTKTAMIRFLKVALSKRTDFSAHKTLIPMLNFTNAQQKLQYWFVVLTGEEIGCNLNQIAQKIPLESPSPRKIFLENKEHVILPSGPEPACSGPRRRQISCPRNTSFSFRETPFPSWEAFLLYPGAVCKDTLFLLALCTRRQRWKGVNCQAC